jgi:hypothetical protein
MANTGGRIESTGRLAATILDCLANVHMNTTTGSATRVFKHPEYWDSPSSVGGSDAIFSKLDSITGCWEMTEAAPIDRMDNIDKIPQMARMDSSGKLILPLPEDNSSASLGRMRMRVSSVHKGSLVNASPSCCTDVEDDAVEYAMVSPLSVEASGCAMMEG